MKHEGKRILIFNVNWLGDVLFSTAAIRNIRDNYPDSYIACIIPERCAPVIKHNPHLNEIIFFDERLAHKSTVEKLKFVRLLKAKKFDVAILLHRSFTRALLCRLAGIRQRIGYSTRKRAFLLTKQVKPPPKNAILHRIDYYLRVIEEAGFTVTSRRTELFFSKADKAHLDSFLSAQGVGPDDKLIGINPGGNWLLKRWLVENWARLADRLIEELGVKVIITGDKSDADLGSAVKKLMKQVPIFGWGALGLLQFAALCKRLDIFITADTGPMHIANSVGTKQIIALFGPTHSAVTGPYPLGSSIVLQKDVGCPVPCYVVGCKDNRCMKAITVEEVFQKVKGLIETG